jgi:hypothetical protein
MGKGRSHTKRKAGHIGFQANEIAFIEDEMAALAAEYGLHVDQEIAAHVSHRRDHKKKARLRRLDDAATSSSATTDSSAAHSVRLLAPARRRVVIRKDFDGDHDLVRKILRNVLPEGVALAQCDVPGCGCARGHRELSLHDSEQDGVATERDVIGRGVCKKCHHGVLQHALVLADDSSGSDKPSGSGGFQRLLGALFQLVRTGRLAGTVFRSRVWVASILTLLAAQLAQLKKQISAGGAQNGQKTLAELQQEHSVLTELTSLLQKAEHACQKAVSREALAIEWAIALDPMYFRLYYACITVYGRACAAVPPPEEYFSDLESFTPDVFAQVEAFVNQELALPRGGEPDVALVQSLALPLVTAASSNRKKKQEHATTNGGSATGTGMALLDIFHARFREGVRLFYESSIGMHGEMDAVLSNAGGVLSGAAVTTTSRGSKKKPHRRDKDATSAKDKSAVASSLSGLAEVPAFELLAQWRNNCRDWCSHLYAYATPSPDALAVLAKYAPLVEMGAGTGYWASLLAARGVDVMAFDVCPPSLHQSSEAEDDGPFAHLHKKKKPSNEPTQNADHGQVRTFTSVAKGGPETLTSDEATHERTLFLCSPPPLDDMARQSLRCFKGDHVVYVGEWQGDTADRAFENELVKRFVNVEEVELPNWGNSAYSLTVWKRKPTNRRGQHSQPSILKRLSCFHCHASLLERTSDEDAEDFKRCVLCRTNVYCSEDCSTAHRRAHAAEHAKRLVFLEDETKLDFENDLHYKPMLAMATEEEEEEKEEEEGEAKVVVAKANWKAVTSRGNEAKVGQKRVGGDFAFNFGS